MSLLKFLKLKAVMLEIGSRVCAEVEKRQSIFQNIYMRFL